VEKRKKNFKEIVMPFTENQARREARRCLRCDLEFTRQENKSNSRGDKKTGEYKV
jgi:NADPH-dependent glutamate synthase beta subunit-like oxidoreductase